VIFSSSIFLLYFLPIFLLVYNIIDRKLKNYTILAASIFFYSWGAPKFLFLILGSTIIDFYIVKKLYNSNSTPNRKILLALSIFINLGLLVYFKYSNFFVENLNTSLQSLGFTQLGWTSVVLPIGISFYTFQTLTYSIDVYRKIHAPLKKVTDYLLYIMSFPQMIAGPIVRFNSIADQIVDRKETLDDKLMGFYRFSIGLAKKVLIANVMAEQAELIFNSDFNQLSTANAWLGMLAYTFQIYFDFSGYSDMAIGLGRMIGFQFPENFDSPYVSRSISEFWRRWHITLGNFMKDYLYIPLGGNKVTSKYRLFFNLGIVFLLSGLWHGASWNFIIWGVYHGLFLILDRLFLLKLLQKIGKVPATLFTFLIVMIGWVIFRIEDLAGIKIYLKTLFSFKSSIEFDTTPAFGVVVILAIFFSFFVSLKKGKQIEEYIYHAKEYRLNDHVLLTISSIILFTLAVSSITSSGFNPFIYFRF
jgi:alginate O-acetyltransferase complex protein AlgI